MIEQFYAVRGFTGNPAGGPAVTDSGMVSGPKFAADAAQAKAISLGGLGAFMAHVALHFPTLIAPYYVAQPPSSFLIERWSPLEAPDIRIWLNGTQLPAPGGSVALWPDDSGNGFHVEQPVVVNQPVSNAGLTRSAYFTTGANTDPNASFMKNDAFLAASTCMLFVVGQFVGAMGGPLTASHMVCDTTPSVPRLRIAPGSAPPPAFPWEVVTGPAVQGSQYDNAAHVFAVEYGPGAIDLYIDGVVDASGVVATVPWIGLMVGADPDGPPVAFGWNGRIGSILVYNGTFSTADRTMTTTYLALIHGIVL